jgi:hypothetical protein
MIENEIFVSSKSDFSKPARALHLLSCHSIFHWRETSQGVREHGFSFFTLFSLDSTALRMNDEISNSCLSPLFLSLVLH